MCHAAQRAVCSAMFFSLFLQITFSGQTSHPVISGSTEPIFTKFSPHGKYLIVDY